MFVDNMVIKKFNGMIKEYTEKITVVTNSFSFGGLGHQGNSGVFVGETFVHSCEIKLFNENGGNTYDTSSK